jgi:hypothetical protein
LQRFSCKSEGKESPQITLIGAGGKTCLQHIAVARPDERSLSPRIARMNATRMIRVFLRAFAAKILINVYQRKSAALLLSAPIRENPP